MDLQAWMDRGRAMDCTDFHLTVGLPVVARMLGELTIIGDEPLTKEDIHSMLATVMNRIQQEEYQKGGSGLWIPGCAWLQRACQRLLSERQSMRSAASFAQYDSFF